MVGEWSNDSRSVMLNHQCTLGCVWAPRPKASAKKEADITEAERPAMLPMCYLRLQRRRERNPMTLILLVEIVRDGRGSDNLQREIDAFIRLARMADQYDLSDEMKRHVI